MARQMSRRKGAWRQACPACDGRGEVCCVTWAEVRATAGDDLKFSGVGLPLWPLSLNTECTWCPFCGTKFTPSGRSS